MSFLLSGSTGGTRATSSRASGIEPFPDPFFDYASLAMPETLDDALLWCEYLILSNNVYRAALDRVIGYFITDVEVEDTDSDTKEKYKTFLHDTLGINSLLARVALDYMTYGNCFVSFVTPFQRTLSCPSCGFEAPLQQVARNPKFSFSWNYQFNAKCPFCNYSGRWSHTDRRILDEDRMQVKRWSPHEMELLWDPYTDSVDYIWKIPQYYKDKITRGTLYQLERAPWEVVEATRRNNYLRFGDDVIYHAKEDTLAGVLNKGWGISRVLTNFRQAWYVQVLHRFNEAIGLDYIIPFRVITPEARTGGGEMNDPLFTIDLGGFTGQVNSMLRRRRRDPATWHTLPFPVRYQALGGEASQLAPYELLDQGVDNLLNGVGMPVAFYKGDLTLQGAPAALRILDSNFSHLTYMLNKFLQWLGRKISNTMSWDEVTLRLMKPSHADDLNRQLAKLQLMMGRQISQTTGLKSVGLDFEDEQRRMLEEEKFVAEEGQQVQEELEASGFGDMMASGQMAPGAQPAAPPAGGGAAPAPAPAGGAGAAVPPPVDPVQAVLAMLPQGPHQSMTPQEMLSMATTIAKMLFSMPETQKDSALRQLKNAAPHIHQLVKSQLEGLRNQAGNQGVAMAQQAAQMQQVPVGV